ncbi:ribonuclease HI family protein [Candidatus Microgenomates bacterium]|nr:ribonuclease HI family protein [Candidatus Microgenomates bacterium]
MEGNILKVYCDGGSRGNPGPGASAFVVINGEHIVAEHGVFLGHTTNNQAEYNAVLLAFSYLEQTVGPQKKFDKIDRIAFYLDSELVAHQLSGRFKIRDKKLQSLAVNIKKKEHDLNLPVTYYTIPRRENKRADFLVNQVLNKSRVR